MAKKIEEINERIKTGKAVVYTAEEIISVVKEKGLKEAAEQVDVVTTGTFGPMCSSSAYFNLGHSKPRIKLGGGNATLNDIPAYTGFAAVDVLLGATAMPLRDPLNEVFPGAFQYGGGHLIEELLAGKEVRLRAQAYGTDCYPRREIETMVSLKDMNEAVLFNPRNAYQNYNVGVNKSDRTIYTYMGVLLPRMGNANYSSAGQLSPLLNDPLYRTIGIGTKLFLGGGIGYVCWNGTQHNPGVARTERGVPRFPSGTLALMGDLKQMSAQWIRGASFRGYGVSMAVGVGVPIPVLDEETLMYTTVTDADIVAQVVDYSVNYPQMIPGSLGEVTYAQLKSGVIEIEGKKIKTGSLSSYVRARQIAQILKEWIEKGAFTLSSPVAPLPGPDDNVKLKPMPLRP
jgi:L-aspartate semialdehyde sulfurtransferase